MRTLILSSAFAITFCWAVAVLLVRRWLMPRDRANPKLRWLTHDPAQNVNAPEPPAPRRDNGSRWSTGPWSWMAR
jgi:hypothetical protein